MSHHMLLTCCCDSTPCQVAKLCDDDSVVGYVDVADGLTTGKSYYDGSDCVYLEAATCSGATVYLDTTGWIEFATCVDCDNQYGPMTCTCTDEFAATLADSYTVTVTVSGQRNCIGDPAPYPCYEAGTFGCCDYFVTEDIIVTRLGEGALACIWEGELAGTDCSPIIEATLSLASSPCRWRLDTLFAGSSHSTSRTTGSTPLGLTGSKTLTEGSPVCSRTYTHTVS